MKFEIVYNDLHSEGEEVYNTSDGFFDCRPLVNVVDINLLIMYLDIAICAEDMSVLFIWGCSPQISWIKAKLTVPFASEGKLRLIGEYESGHSWRIDKDEVWRAYFDESTGWFCLNHEVITEGDRAVKVLKNLILVIDKTGKLRAIWIHPVFV